MPGHLVRATRRIADWRVWLVWIGPVFVVVGFFAERMWRTFPAPRALEMLVLATLASVAGILVRRLIRLPLATSLALVFLVALVCFAGPLASMATLLLIAAGAAIGHRAVDGATDATAIVAGLSLIAASIGWLLPFPVHYSLVYFVASCLVVILGRRSLVASAIVWSEAWNDAVIGSPRVAAFAVLVVGLASAGCWLPTLQYDDLSYHLGLPWQLTTLHYYRMDVQSQFWALAPWSGDIVQAIPQVLTGYETRGAVDGAWLIVIAVLAWQLTQAFGAPTYARWLTVALAASQPLTAALVGGMQAELPATAATLALAAIAAAAESNRRAVARFALIAGFLIALKTGFVAIVIPLAIWFGWRVRVGFSQSCAAIAIFFFACASSYVYAALVTGDPFFPLLTQTFPSPFPSAAMADSRWSAPVDAAVVWRLTFDTSRYTEGWNGAAGFSLLGLIGATLAALTLRKTRAPAVCAMLAFIAAIGTVHYFRYTFPAIVLMTPIAIATAASTVSRRQLTYLAVALIVLDLGYQSCSYWTLHVGGIKQRVVAGNDALFERLTPERVLLQTVREHDPRANVVFASPGATFGAELAGRGFVTTHYDLELENLRSQADADASGARWRDLLNHTDATYAIVTAKNAALTAALDDAKLVRDINGTQLWALPRVRGEDRLFIVRDQARKRFWSDEPSAQ